MIRILFTVFLSATCFLIHGQIKVGAVNLKSKQNTDTISNVSNGNGAHERSSSTEELIVGGLPYFYNYPWAVSQNIIERNQLESQIEHIKAKKKEIRSNKELFSSSKKNGTWKKLKNAEKIAKAKLKEAQK